MPAEKGRHRADLLATPTATMPAVRAAPGDRPAGRHRRKSRARLAGAVARMLGRNKH